MNILILHFKTLLVFGGEEQLLKTHNKVSIKASKYGIGMDMGSADCSLRCRKICGTRSHSICKSISLYVLFEAIQNELNDEERGLIALQQDLEHKLEQERKNAKVANKTVENWMKDTKEVLNNVLVLQTATKEDQRCLNNSCPNWFWRYRRSKEAKALTTNLKNLKEKHSKLPQELTHEVNLPNIEFIQSDEFMPSSEIAFGEIMTALETDGVNIIGLHGMPGVGKTTLAKEVQKKAKEKELFDEYLMVTVSEKPNISRIQRRLAEQLKVVLEKNSSKEEKASKLMFRLLDKDKKLLVLDDVWGELNLSEIGIPSLQDIQNCKILLTTRRIPACEAMKCQKMILLDILNEDESWALFKNAANLNDDSLPDEANTVAKECSGLPLAIMSVGKALRGKTKHNAWEEALKMLQEGEIEDIRDINRDKNAYRSIKFSFDSLPRQKTKRCLLLCAFFPEDYVIFVPQLASYASRLGIWVRPYKDLNTVGEFAEEVDELRNSHLLLESEILKGAFTMHDLVRDIVLRLGKRYSKVGDPITEEFIMESLALQMIAEQHFQMDGLISTPKESFTADVSITEFTKFKDLILYTSAESALVQIIKALQTDGINMIGLHGMGRVGKTSWALQILDGAARMQLFEECVFVEVFEEPDIKEIQSKIATILKLELRERSSTRHRAIHLRQRLMDDKKKLLVLDNVWRELDLNAIGIPSTGNLKLLITTPRKSVCTAMKCQSKILLDQLTKDEERSLIEKIKNSTLEESVKFAAYKNIEKCRRFPGAFQAGRLVDCEKKFQSTLLESMSFEPTRIFYDISTIWSKFSEEHKRCMLLCCLYAPVDEEISVEELGRYAYALGMYGSTIEHTMERLMMAIDNFSDYHFVFPSTRSERKIRLHVGARDYALLYEGNTNSFEF